MLMLLTRSLLDYINVVKRTKRVGSGDRNEDDVKVATYLCSPSIIGFSYLHWPRRVRETESISGCTSRATIDSESIVLPMFKILYQT